MKKEYFKDVIKNPNGKFVVKIAINIIDLENEEPEIIAGVMYHEVRGHALKSEIVHKYINGKSYKTLLKATTDKEDHLEYGEAYYGDISVPGSPCDQFMKQVNEATKTINNTSNPEERK